ncbi:hypothetical protein BC829DRAFT_492297 [Chytridium lagenaria]|nr:hypothetical protein BC829DRAFT_492297 [Chytridium lagenaria]
MQLTQTLLTITLLASSVLAQYGHDGNDYNKPPVDDAAPISLAVEPISDAAAIPVSSYAKPPTTEYGKPVIEVAPVITAAVSTPVEYNKDPTPSVAVAAVAATTAAYDSYGKPGYAKPAEPSVAVANVAVTPVETPAYGLPATTAVGGVKSTVANLVQSGAGRVGWVAGGIVGVLGVMVVVV